MFFNRYSGKYSEMALRNITRKFRDEYSQFTSCFAKKTKAHICAFSIKVLRSFYKSDRISSL